MAQEVSIHLKYLRHSARKVRPVARLFVGKNLEKSIDKSSLMTQDSARFLHQAMNMALAAATAKEFQSGDLIIKTINVTEGPKIKRMRPNARGRSNRYLKMLSHILLTVEEKKVEPKAKKVAKKEVKAEETK